MGVSGEELDDACQEVFVQVFRYLARFEHRADFQTWLYRLCLTQASRLRRRRKMHDTLGWLLRRQTPPHQPDAGLAWSETMAAERVRHALDRMKPVHREVFVLFELEGAEGAEIARILACPATTVRRRLHYARLEFEQLLRNGVGEGPKGRP